MALFIIADDSHRIGKMRGRGGYTDAVIPPRRKPVSIEDVDHIYTGSRKAARISDFANEDSEDLSARSRQKDRKLLDDITTKLVNTSYKEPIKVQRTGARRPPVVVTPVAGRKPATSAPRRVGIRPVPSLARSYRASSLPPTYVEEEVVTPYNFYEPPPVIIKSKPQYQPGPYVPAPAAVSPKAQFPKPNRARSEPPLTRSSNLAVKNARRCLDRIERELGVDDGELYSYGGPPPAPAPVAREVRARTAVRGGGGRPAGAVKRRPGSLPPSSSRNKVNQAEIEREVEEYLERPTIKPSLRTRAASLERQRIRTSSAAPSLAIRRSSLSGPVALPVERMPGLDPYRPKQGSSGTDYSGGNNYGGSAVAYTAITPYTPARVNKSTPAIGGLPPKAPAFRPEMSDTRKRIRDVICMTRRDPTYYS